MGDRPRRSQPSPADDAKPSALDATAEPLMDSHYLANILSQMQSNMKKAVDDRLADQRQAAADRLADQNETAALRR